MRAMPACVPSLSSSKNVIQRHDQRPGALLELTDGRAVQVIRGNPDHPYLPVVRELHPGGTLARSLICRQ